MSRATHNSTRCRNNGPATNVAVDQSRVELHGIDGAVLDLAPTDRERRVGTPRERQQREDQRSDRDCVIGEVSQDSCQVNLSFVNRSGSCPRQPERPCPTGQRAVRLRTSCCHYSPRSPKATSGRQAEPAQAVALPARRPTVCSPPPRIGCEPLCAASPDVTASLDASSDVALRRSRSGDAAQPPGSSPATAAPQNDEPPSRALERSAIR